MASNKRIQCPYCYEEAVKFITTEECRQHVLEEHEEEMKEPLGHGFFFEDYLAEEQLFFELKDRFKDSEEDLAALEVAIGKLSDDRRERLMVLRLAISLWPCRHENGEDDDGEINLNGCCEGRRRFGEFMNLICDAYECGGDEQDEGDESAGHL
jgi:hypothetical protein